jgi:hypothetical protein
LVQLSIYHFLNPTVTGWAQQREQPHDSGLRHGHLISSRLLSTDCLMCCCPLLDRSGSSTCKWTSTSTSPAASYFTAGPVHRQTATSLHRTTWLFLSSGVPACFHPLCRLQNPHVRGGPPTPRMSGHRDTGALSEFHSLKRWEHGSHSQTVPPIYSAASIRSTTQALYATSVSTPC